MHTLRLDWEYCERMNAKMEYEYEIKPLAIDEELFHSGAYCHCMLYFTVTCDSNYATVVVHILLSVEIQRYASTYTQYAVGKCEGIELYVVMTSIIDSTLMIFV